MKYQLKNMHIHTATNQRGDYSWMEAELYRDDDPFMNPAQLPRYYVLNEVIVNMYKQAAVVDLALTQQYANDPTRAGKQVLTVDEQKLAETYPHLTHITGIIKVTMPLEGVWGAINQTDQLDAQNRVIARKGDFRINPNGDVTPVTSIVLYLKQGTDNETGETYFVDDPDMTLRRVLERRYKRLDTQPQQAAQQTAAPAASGVTVAAGQAAAPAGVQPQQVQQPTPQQTQAAEQLNAVL